MDETKDFNKVFIEAMQPAVKVYRVPDPQTRGLYIQMTPAGARSWVLRFRFRGQEKTHSLGRWPEMTVALARKKARSLLVDIGEGKDPQAKREEERRAETVADLVKQFQKEHLPALKKSTSDEYERIIKTRIIPALGTKRVKDIQPSDIARLLSKIRADTPKGILANRTRAVLSKMFTLAELWGLREGKLNPCRGQVHADETHRERHLSDKELVALGAVLREPHVLPAGDDYALAALHLILLTGMRRSEIIGSKLREIPALTWDAVDLEAAQIRLTHHKTARKKGTRTVPLCAAACELLENLPRVLSIPENPYVIPGGVEAESLVNLQKPWDRVCAAVIALQEKNKVPKKDRANISDATIHDLRRSYASLATRMGYPKLIVSSLLGHSASDPTEGYARMGADPLRDVVEVIGARMADLLAGKVNLEAEAKAAKDEAQAKRAAKGATA